MNKRKMPRQISKLARRVLRSMGADVVRATNSPAATLIGLKGHRFDLLLDVGANKGEFTDYFQQMFPGSKAILFEPLPTEFESLRNRFAQRSDIELKNIAIGAEAGEVEMYFDIDHSPSSSLLPSTQSNSELFPQTRRKRGEKIQVSRLDDAVTLEDLNGKSVFIKIDTQGYEARVLAGGSATIAAANAVLMEVITANLYEGQSNSLELFSRMKDLGFRYGGNLSQNFGPSGLCLFCDVLFINDRFAKNAAAE